MSLANYVNNNSNNEKEIDFGNIDIDLDDIVCESVEVKKTLIAPEITNINIEITNLKNEINNIKADLTAFKNDIIGEFQKIFSAFNINSNDKKIITTYDLDIKGSLSQG